MKEQSERSSVWLVSQEPEGLDRKEGKYSKQKLFDYPENPQSILFPIGFVIKHPSNDTNSFEDFGGFTQPVTVHARPIYDGVDVSHLEGELLTVIDAAFADKSQCEAIKSLIRKTVWGFNNRQERKVKEIFKAA